MQDPPFTITPYAIEAIGKIERLLGNADISIVVRQEPKLRKQNRVRTVRDSLAIEGNSLSLDQATAIFENKRVIGPKNEILEIENAIKTYAKAGQWNAQHEKDFLKAHWVLMAGLIKSAGKYRSGSVGILKGTAVSHLAPSAKMVPSLMQNLFRFAAQNNKTHPLILAAVVHYEIEFIHPFEDGNGRMGRLWQHAILRKYHPLFENVPFESVIRQKQKKYYAILEKCDKAGDSSAFIDFSLQTVLTALEEQVKLFSRRRATAGERLSAAKDFFEKDWFNRKKYQKLFSDISLPTASRDLAQALKDKLLKTKGTANQTQYRFEK